jgi:hypothetical protein
LDDALGAFIDVLDQHTLGRYGALGPSRQRAGAAAEFRRRARRGHGSFALSTLLADEQLSCRSVRWRLPEF